MTVSPQREELTDQGQIIWVLIVFLFLSTYFKRKLGKVISTAFNLLTSVSLTDSLADVSQILRHLMTD